MSNTSGSATTPRPPRPRRFVVRPPAPADTAAPQLTVDQQRVVDHVDGPLLVVAGPGTGKTTTVVEAAVRRIEEGAAADEVLVLTFSRRAAIDLRRRISARLGRTTTTPLVFTFHAFCLALLRRFGDREVYGAEVRLLTAPEQEFRLRETLDGVSTESWPDSLQRAKDTRAFVAEMRAVLARTRQWGMDPDDLVAAGESAERPAWVALGEFFDEYLDVLDLEQVLDYAELVHRCRILLTDPDVLEVLRREIAWVHLDEFGETDPSQVELIAELVGPGGHVVATGDPDQSIFGFRGGQGRGVLDFADRFRTSSGGRSPIVSLGRSFRGGPKLQAISRRIARRLPLGRPLPAEVMGPFRQPEPGAAQDQVEAWTCASPGAEAEHIAALLRQAHLHDGVPWSQMAVLVRSGRRAIPPLVRSLTSAGVPVEVAGDEIPLAAELAVRPLLMALRVAAAGRTLDADEAARLLLSPLGGLDSLGLRRLGRCLRTAEQEELNGAGVPRLSDDLIRRALVDPELLDDCPDTAEVRRARRLAELLIDVDTMINSAQATASEALWRLWAATGWPQHLQEASLAGGDTARRADRDLDAVVALFAVANRSEETAGHRGVTSFLAEVEAQQIPGDTLVESGLRGGAVRVLTAHRAKGLEWPLVVVASVQEGTWPDLRGRSSILQADRLTPDGVAEAEPVATRIAEERRLFHVACSRAIRRLVVTAVAGTEGEGDQPSRFVSELGIPIREVTGRPRRPLSLPGLVSELRRTTVDPDEPVALRRAAAARLATLAEATDADGHRLVPQADPATWWGMRESTESETPVDPQQIRMSGSQLGSILSCPRAWFLSRRASAERGRTAAANFGSVVHVLIEHAQRTGEDPYAMASHLDEVWEQINFDAAWLSGVERIAAEAALERFAGWQQQRPGHEVIGVEAGFETTVNCGGVEVVINGTIDRLERDQLGRIHVVDFKTSRAKPPRNAATMEQLGLYQLAVAQGAIDGIPAGTPIAGAELVFLRHETTKAPGVAVGVHQASLDDVPWPEGEVADGEQPDLSNGPTWVHERLARAAGIIRAERYDAIRGESCRWCQFITSCPAQGRGQQVVA
ncbi:ATP-dependent helicase [Propionibacteriaceae bacterium Y1685]|uniref:ATP-dependent helicase n=1 Tax=Microlunatus sp. Y1700 TaxID=3418487 RepID=UPI003B799F15